MKNKDDLENFRKIIRAELIKKGVVPPKINSEKEELLFKKWLKGRQRIKGDDNGN